MQHRAPWTSDGDTWGIPGGARDSHETPVQAALREASEEAGISDLTDRGITGPCHPDYDPYRTSRSESPGGAMVAPSSASAKRLTRWVQGSIIAASAVIILSATVNLVGRTAGPTSPTPSVVTSATVVATTTLVSEPRAAPTDLPASAEQPVPVVVAPATIEAPPLTTAAAEPVIVTYENCTAVWDAIGRPIHRGDPGYSSELDRDGDGTGCEEDPR